MTEPLVQIVRGEPDETELVALMVVLTTMIGAPIAATGTADGPLAAAQPREAAWSRARRSRLGRR